MKGALTYIEPKAIQQTVEEPLMLEFEKGKLGSSRRKRDCK